MVSNIGSRLNNPTLISGFGIHHYRRRPVMHGRGPIRRVTGSIIGTIGHALVNKLASAISGHGYKPTGTGIRHRRPRHTLTHIGGYRKKRVGRPRTRKPRALQSISSLFGPIGGAYRRRRPRAALTGMGRRKHRLHRKILLI